jgi:hypothetical protein
MEKLQLALQVWGAFVILCGLAAKLCPPGKLQAVLAHVGTMATKKDDAEKKDESK